jgi:hypothetical protein
MRYRSVDFPTTLDLEAIAKIIGLEDYYHDWENEYEWVIGTCCDITLIDITRSHQTPIDETETTIFRYKSGDEGYLSKALVNYLVLRLKAANIDKITINGVRFGRNVSKKV